MVPTAPMLRHRTPLALALLLAACPFVLAASLTVDDIVNLVKAGVGEKVILKQAQSTGTSFTLTVEGILALKSAGASDALIEALMEEGEEKQEAVAPPRAEANPAPDDASSESFRIFKSVSEDGQEVIHITNLDEHGRRMGGELTESERRTMLSRAEEYRASDPAPEGSYSDGSREPVVVNIFNPQQEYQPIETPQGGYDSGYGHGIYPGLLATGYYGGGYYGGYKGGGHRDHFPGCGHSVGVVLPGGSGHFNNFHNQRFGIVQPLNSTIPQIINTRPFTRGTAHQRNNRVFGRGRQ